ncbi:unnamed protein product [Ranitomeya imitator]|uniref:Glycinamide ribonucleotide synthetase n=1 Tax=Ranitomeya imitator TaxID=111125 RepID=A0ABN9LVQ6_9NEOB|nr:unnamed protein product [Ranitomeya imitator]
MAAGGDVIHGLTQEPNTSCKVFHAGTTLSENGHVLTNGGRVLCVTALGNSVAEAQQSALAVLKKEIYWEGSFSRTDIGYRAIEREKQSGA